MSPRDAIPFAKAEANGNDFLIVSADALPRGRWSQFARYACDRHCGLGADGVEFVEECGANGGGYEARLTLLNADGGEAEISGNGSRCVAVWLAARRGLRELTLLTAAGPRRAQIGVRGASGAWRVDVEMGSPDFASAAVPVVLPRGEQAQVFDEPFELDGRRWRITALSMGNPHCCLFVDDFPSDWQRIGQQVATHAMFPRCTNVEFVRVAARDQLELRIFERGVGATQSSGTGCCAAAVAAVATGRVHSSMIEVISPGGPQVVSWAGPTVPGAPVHLLGPARIVGEGAIYVE